MKHTRRAETLAGRLARLNPTVEAMTIMVDLLADGTIHAVIGRLDRTSKRYTFTNVQPFDASGWGLPALANGAVEVASTYARDVYDAPW